RRRLSRRANRAVAERAVRFAVIGVRARFRGHVDRARGSQVVGKIERRLRQRKFLDGAGRNVFRRRAYGLIADVDSIDVDARRAAEAPAKRDRGISDFGRIEILTVLNLYAGFKLGEIEEVASIDREVFNL